jgi:hypothetical protein
MKKIILTLLFLINTLVFFSQEEDSQGKIFPKPSTFDIDKLLLSSYAYGHKSFYIVGDSIFHINKNGKRRVKISDIDYKSIVVEKDESNYKVTINCNGNLKKMVADWGTYSNFNFVVRDKKSADEISLQFKKLLNDLGY